ncbi:hypothetical protein BU16DRAFT_186544 [Lophium mytilinum]|uniref:BZIP domain-containing protein n=1 Tax=Lophium mytilinum TaxID=390894 RepID=A0A6A6R8L7_9PEZI|nr:hypothetical protein BU16DRAFT_186544 [Lophium mytilinum]
MSSRRKTSQASTGLAESKVERKRVQNRIAQQHAREKQLARIQELESFVHRIRSTVDEDGAGEDDATWMEGNPKLTKTFLEVLDENTKLKQGLLKMRKSMINLSTQAADGAGDAIYERLIARTGYREASEPSDPTIQSIATSSGLQEPTVHASSVHFSGPRQELHENMIWDHTMGHDSGTFPVITSNATFNTLAKSSHDSSQCLDAFNFNAAGELVLKPIKDLLQSNDPNRQHVETQTPDMAYNTGNQLSFHEMRAHEILLTSNRSPQQSQQRDEDSFFQLYNSQPAELHAESQLVDTASRPSLNASFGSSSVIEHFEHVLLIYISQMQQLTEADWKSLLAAAVRVLFSWTHCGEYALCIGQGKLHESIVRWRLEPTAANRQAILEPFRPSDLQSVVINTTRYSPWLDYIPWPELRDQVLFRKDTIDPGDVLQDILENAVLELPHLGVAVLMFSLFLETRKKLVTSELYDRQESYEGVDGTRSLESSLDSNKFIRKTFAPEELPVEPAAAILQFKQEMDAEVEFSSKEIATCPAPSAASRRFNARLVQDLQAQFTAKYCIANTERWKLSPAMGVKYPFMRTSNIQTRLPIISASLLLGC